MRNEIKRTPEKVVDELRRRAAKGRSLKSGDNRGDWLYASALKRFGSWRAAVEAAGFNYEEIVTKPFNAEGVLEQLRTLAAEGDALIAGQHTKLAAAAIRHYGSWKNAIEAAGVKMPDRRRWTPERVIEAIRQEREAGRSLGGGAVNDRNPNLYAGGRRRFGTWLAAVEAASPPRARRRSR